MYIAGIKEKEKQMTYHTKGKKTFYSYNRNTENRQWKSLNKTVLLLFIYRNTVINGQKHKKAKLNLTYG